MQIRHRLHSHQYNFMCWHSCKCQGMTVTHSTKQNAQLIQTNPPPLTYTNTTLKLRCGLRVQFWLLLKIELTNHCTRHFTSDYNNSINSWQTYHSDCSVSRVTVHPCIDASETALRHASNKDFGPHALTDSEACLLC